MAPKRGRKPTKIVAKSIDYNNLKLSESLCPICRSILVEPVTLPCNHGFCSSCFEGTMANSNLVCPLCRLRIGSWLRSARKEKKLVNATYWKAIRDQFPLQIHNRLQGLEEAIPEDIPKIKLSDPGEIRREYEVQKEKDEEEFRRTKAREEKASEALLKKYQEELEYQKTVEEEKIKQDEEVARKLAEKLAAQAGPSKSGAVAKKLGTLDGFLKSKPLITSLTPAKCKSIPAPTKNKRPDMTYSSSMQKKLDPSFNCNVRLNNSLSNYATKEYTCIILKQNNTNQQNQQKQQNQQQSSSSSNVSFIRKKCQQLQKLMEVEYVSDSSDCIESECRYFKPIDYKFNPRCSYKSPIKVPSTYVRVRNPSTEVRPPNGQMLFSISEVSAFARLPSPLQDRLVESKDETQAVSNGNAKHKLHNSGTETRRAPTNMKRKNQNPNPSGDIGKKIKLSREMCDVGKLRTNGMIVKPLVASESPPLCGFKRENLRSQNNRKLPNGLHAQDLKKRLQEKADLEFARKLHNELNNHSRYATRSNSNKRKARRQMTLDEIVVTM